MNRIGVLHDLADHGVTGLVIRGDDPVFFGHDHAAALGAHHDLVFGLLEVGHFNQTRTAASGEQRGLIDQVGQVGTGEARAPTRDDFRPHVGSNRHLAHVHVEDLLATADIRQRHDNLAVETTRTHQGRIKHVGTVGSSHHDDALAGFKAVHFHQQLVQGLLTLVVTAAQTSTTLATDRVDLVNEDDTWRMLFRVFEHVANTGRTDTDKHFHEVGTRNREERHLGLAGNGFGEQRFTGTRRTDHQHAARDTPAQLLEFGGVTQEVDQLLDFFLGFITAGNVGKRDRVVGFVEHASARLAERECPAPATALHLAHEEHPDADQQQHREPGHEDAEQQRLLLFGLGLDRDAVFHQVANHPDVIGGKRGNRLVVAGATTQRTAIDGDRFDLPVFGLLHELRVRNIIATCLPAIELFEDSEQHESDHEPDGCFGEHIVHRVELRGRRGFKIMILRMLGRSRHQQGSGKSLI